MERLTEGAGSACWLRGFGFGAAAALLLLVSAVTAARAIRSLIATRKHYKQIKRTQRPRAEPRPSSPPPELQPAPEEAKEALKSNNEAALVTAAIDVTGARPPERKSKRAKKDDVGEDKNLIEFV